MVPKNLQGLLFIKDKFATLFFEHLIIKYSLMPHCMKVYTLLHVHMDVVCIAWHVINECCFACISDNLGHYLLAHMSLLFAFLSSCCCSPFAVVIFLLHIISWPILFWGWAVMKHCWKSYLVLWDLDIVGDKLTMVDGGSVWLEPLHVLFSWMSIILDWNPFLSYWLDINQTERHLAQ